MRRSRRTRSTATWCSTSATRSRSTWRRSASGTLSTTSSLRTCRRGAPASAEASKKQKLFLMSWCPDTAKVKKKMLYSSSFDALKKSLVGVQKYIQATDLSEASQEAVEEKLRATDRQ
ncbi:unnamed protein product [Leptidea sinapis]|uniref:ADF-H domain-containing protein n=1 Tax=Leptidea sinapis TaxID=189913 RepID=A0A5E4QAU3_9NEOP|nr:unnamed protein product [Leptidea sinapis]